MAGTNDSICASWSVRTGEIKHCEEIEKVFWLHERAFFQTEYNLQTV